MFLKIRLVLLLSLSLTIQDISAAITNSDWWKHAVFYQIYPRSFKDDNNDGIGDLKGIITKLDHLKDAGVTAAWLSPIYESPQVDQGYDISNFIEINSDYGSMSDFELLISEAHKKGIKIIMDFVPNHSSDQHVWFKKSENRTAGFENYYVWRNGTSNTIPPNNWISVFKYSAWKYSSIRGQFYLHQFAEAQPDLNYRCSKVVQEMKDVLKFWLDKGVDGFRMDAVPFLFEDERFKDEPRSNIPNVPNYMTTYVRHVYTQDQPETLDMIYQWRKYLDDYNNEKGGDPRIMMTEVYSDILTTMYYYGNEGADGAHFTFNFFLITDLNKNSSARDIASTVEKWTKNMPKRYSANWVVGNHDNTRVATRFGPKNVDAYNMLVALLPGIMVTYNGEEIGQENGEVTYEEGHDPNACNAPKEDFALISRDLERTPYQWDTSINAGFNNGSKPWLPVSVKFNETNLAAQKNTNVNSHYQIYKKLTRLRQQNSFKYGDLKIRAVSDDVLVFSRGLSNGTTHIVILNLSDKQKNIDIDRDLFSATQYLEVVIVSVTSPRNIDDLISTKNLLLSAHESLVAVTTQRIPNTTIPPTSATSGSSENSTTSSTSTQKPNGETACATSKVVLLITLICITVLA